ncbi:MAG TPA: acyl-CoA dehydrogenase family protein [Blastocatellia bacterium]|nr:acyl-CoA dehydrogenase family protein [Blastocatellia bacterium]
MHVELTEQQLARQQEFAAFVDREVAPFADGFDRAEAIAPELIEKLARAGYLALTLPVEYGGEAESMITYGLLHEQVGRGCSSVRSILTVHTMVAHAIARWGSAAQKKRLLPRLASGEMVAAFCLTEAHAGSDARNMEAVATKTPDGFRLSGHKKWITAGQIARLYLVLAQCDRQPCAFLVERDTPGLSIHPIAGMLGVRASMLADLVLRDCQVSEEMRVGPIGFGFSHVAGAALDLGRYSVACGCVGIAQACLDACERYVGHRRQFGVLIREHQLIQKMLTEAMVGTQAARLMCYRAGYLRDKRDAGAMLETAMAKYFASRMATKIAADAVQIHGANGCSADYPVQRYLRDAKIMEIIEGSTQVMETLIANIGLDSRPALENPGVGSGPQKPSDPSY